MQLTENFTLEEAIFSHTAIKQGIDNYPIDNLFINNIKYTAQRMETIRSALSDNPIKVLSWYRTMELNYAIGGAPNSYHTYGRAIDFICPNYGSPYDCIKQIYDSGLSFEQMILEFNGWVHIAFLEDAESREILRIDKKRRYEKLILG